ncbi:hypothetical protein COZ78_01700 [bacterium (Candidatus Gribaldobacteria) CG_4_8_14_3_um_filter_42_11]|uniref:Uncharacterized protein n=2 Tax=Candidatus Gribaldobacteria TaxID=2798536 RepID=A0A2H0UWC3_9BACT|nr:MAG: hypothetical protein COU03_03035 [bacterium (Candidatus Gribaldobacteria) CG10_big_fil_rev_8_21_14_0_10_41_12]PIX03171.1 MAG: hypothetical protein COZ78_01700 [bacterium (Candidatus Gribaldobacteria) CG_4_8_14_3_um_filter_42_11]
MTQVLTIYFLKLKGVVMGHFNKDGEYIRLNNEPGKPENRRNESSGSEHSSSGGGGGVGCVIAIVAGIIIFLLFFIALIVGIGGNATGHWGFMLALLKIVWWPIKTLFVIVWAVVKAIVWIADKITVPGLLIIALISLAVGAIIIFRRKG